MSLERINDWRLTEELSRPGPLIVMLGGSGVKACVEPRREFHELACSYSEIRFREVDLVEHPTLAVRLSIRRIPTTIVYLDGVEQVRHEGGDVAGILGPTLGEEE